MKNTFKSITEVWNAQMKKRGADNPPVGKTNLLRREPVAAKRPQPPSMDVAAMSEFFKRHPKLETRYRAGTKCRNAELMGAGQACWKGQTLELKRRRAQEAYQTELEAAMVREMGMLAMLEQMLEAALDGNRTRWELYREYLQEAAEKLEALQKQPELPSGYAEPEMPKTGRELAAALEQQWRQLAEPETASEYMGLLDLIRQILKQELSDRWHGETTRFLGQQMQKLEPSLREALAERFPGLLR